MGLEPRPSSQSVIDILTELSTPGLKMNCYALKIHEINTYHFLIKYLFEIVLLFHRPR
jgi:hypothetical protein